MRSAIASRRAAIAASFLVVLASAPVHAFVIGGLDLARGGAYSPEFGSATGGFRTHVAATFPGTTFSSAPTLTASFLSGVDVLIIAAPAGSTTPITPLGAAEQAAMTSFVLAGGSALLLSDNDFQFEAASDSMVGPFGLDADGALVGTVTGTVTASHPVTNGPFGTVTTLSYGFPGWFPTLGPNAVALASLDANSQISLAAIDHGILGPGSGAVIFFSDSTIGAMTGSNLTLVDNALAYAVPEPGPLALLGIALVVRQLLRAPTSSSTRRRTGSMPPPTSD